MKVTTYEGIVEKGRVLLPDNAEIPDKTKVYVVVPASESVLSVRMMSPHLAHPEQAADFEKTVTVEPDDAHV